MIGSRSASAIRLIGFHSAIVLAGSSSRFSGKKAEDRNRITNTIGKMPCATLGLPLLRAIAAPIVPHAIAFRPTSIRTTSTPGTPATISAPNTSPTARNHSPAISPITPVATNRPSTKDHRAIGAATSLSTKPIWMSSASAIAALTPASMVDWSIAPASWKSRKPFTGGNSGRSTARPAPPVFTARNSDGKTMIGARNCGRRKA